MSDNAINGLNQNAAYNTGDIKSSVATSKTVDDFAKTYREVGKKVAESGTVGANAIRQSEPKKTAQTGDFISLEDAQKEKSDILPTNDNTQYMMKMYESMKMKSELSNAMKSIFSGTDGKGSDMMDLFSMSDFFE